MRFPKTSYVAQWQSGHFVSESLTINRLCCSGKVFGLPPNPAEIKTLRISMEPCQAIMYGKTAYFVSTLTKTKKFKYDALRFFYSFNFSTSLKITSPTQININSLKVFKKYIRGILPYSNPITFNAHKGKFFGERKNPFAATIRRRMKDVTGQNTLKVLNQLLFCVSVIRFKKESGEKPKTQQSEVNGSLVFRGRDELITKRGSYCCYQMGIPFLFIISSLSHD